MHTTITGIILAGGRATRMGGKDKGLVHFMDKPLYQHVIGRLRPQVSTILLNANRSRHIYQQENYPVIADTLPDYPGPLAGMLSGLQHSTTEWILTSPCDTPFLPMDLAERLWRQKGDSLIAYAQDGERAHPTMALIHSSMCHPLSLFLLQGNRKILLFFAQQQATAVCFADNPQAFYNINTLEEAQQWHNKLTEKMGIAEKI